MRKYISDGLSYGIAQSFTKRRGRETEFRRLLWHLAIKICNISSSKPEEGEIRERMRARHTEEASRVGGFSQLVQAC